MPQTIKVYTDEGIDTAIIKGLRLHGLDVLSAPEAGMLGKTDEEQLELAKQEGRAIFVRDTDFLALAKTVLDHPGIIYANQQRSIGECVRAIVSLWNTTNAADMVGRLFFV